jgi:transcriptional regulator with XRE-family HTH domain
MMMKINQSSKKHSSKILHDLLNEITPEEHEQAYTKMIVAANLSDLILSKGWSQTTFAEKLNKNPSEISKWLSGTQNFTLDTLSEIAVIFDIPVSVFFNLSQIKKNNQSQMVIALKEVKPSIQYITPCEEYSEWIKIPH